VALDELVIDGLTTNVEIHKALLENETFLEGRMTTQHARSGGQRGVPRRRGALVTSDARDPR